MGLVVLKAGVARGEEELKKELVRMIRNEIVPIKK